MLNKNPGEGFAFNIWHQGRFGQMANICHQGRWWVCWQVWDEMKR